MYTIYANDGRQERIILNVAKNALTTYIDALKSQYEHVMVFAQN